MATYNVLANPYYQPMRGRNILSDRLLAALQSFSAPENGVFGPRANFGSALLGSDVNRMNQAAAMREQDVAAGRVPFEAEAGQETKMEDSRQGMIKGLQSERLKQEREQEEADRQARVAAQQREIAAAAEAQAKAFQQQGLMSEQELGNRLTLGTQQFNQERALRNTPAPMSDFERAQINAPRPVGNFGFYSPQQGLTLVPNAMDTPMTGAYAPKPYVPVGSQIPPAGWARLQQFNKPTSPAIDQRTLDGDLRWVQDMLREQKPLGISY